MKYVDSVVTFQEVPDEITLCINISNCKIHCKGCHSPYLWEDIGEELNIDSLQKLVKENDGITCISFMGGTDEVLNLAKWIKNNTNLKTCWYTSNTLDSITFEYNDLDYLKTGPYIESLGGLNSPTTNQRFYKIIEINDKDYPYHILDDITYKFQKK